MVLRLVHFHALAMVVAALALSEMAAAGPQLTPHTAEYKVKISLLSGRLDTELRTTERGYRATHRVQPTGLARVVARGAIEEVSDFIVSDDGVLPIHYVSHDTLSGDVTHAEVDFDWANRSMVGVVNKAEVTAALETLVRDRVSIQYQLMHDLLRGGGNRQYTYFDIDEFKTVNIRNIGTKEVRVPAGRFEAVGIQHQRENSSRVTTLWCVEALDYLPVIIEQHRKGKRQLYAALREYTPTPPATDAATAH